jgi:hypothetical protein
MADATHNHFLDEYSFLVQPQESAWEPQWDDSFEFTLPVSPGIPNDPPPHTLDGQYARMTLDKQEIPLFDLHAGFAVFNVHASEHETELCGVLGSTFKCLKYQDKTDTRSSEQLILELQDHSNYAVEKVERVMNKAQYNLYKAVAQTYNLHTSIRAYHGTTKVASDSIINTGFKGAACERALYGKGVYTSPDPWVALGFATPYEHTRQVFFAVEYLHGPSATGHQDQVDFGLDAQGHEVLTLTSPDGTIFCASRENQLLVTHRITVRYMSERPFTQRVKNCLHVVHSHIGTVIKNAAHPPAAPDAGAAPVAGVTPASATPASATSVNAVVTKAPKKEVDTTHDLYKVGDRVIVTGAVKSYADLTPQRGVIKRIVQGRNYFFCVLLDCPESRQAVKDLNSVRVNRLRFPFLEADEADLFCVKVGNILKDTTHMDVSNGRSALGKRKADAA